MGVAGNATGFVGMVAIIRCTPIPLPTVVVVFGTIVLSGPFDLVLGENGSGRYGSIGKICRVIFAEGKGCNRISS